jgi:protease I
VAPLAGKTIAFLATDGVEQPELERTWRAVEEAGGVAVLVSIRDGEIQAYRRRDPGDRFAVDVAVGGADAGHYDGLVIPGGLPSPDRLRQQPDAVGFVRGFFEEGMPVGTLGHGPCALVEADVVRGRTLTSYPSVATDIVNAGGEWVDRDVCVDGGLVSGGGATALGEFCWTLVERLAAGPDERQTDSITRRPRLRLVA